jgi:hypothetical protein
VTGEVASDEKFGGFIEGVLGGARVAGFKNLVGTPSP